MLIIPAIDLKDGCVVRLVQGRKDEKIYSRDPIRTAKYWVNQGAKLIHIVDLDGAATGTPLNLEAAKKIVKAIDVAVQFGGGVRKIETIKKLLDCGIARVVLGTKAIEDRNFLKKAFKQFKNKVIVSIDAQGEELKTKGWRSSYKAQNALEFAQELEKIGFKEIIYTQITKDGTLKGPDIKGLKALLKATKLKIIASGGISSLDDIFKIERAGSKRITAVIVGKALYEGRFTLTEALKKC